MQQNFFISITWLNPMENLGNRSQFLFSLNSLALSRLPQRSAAKTPGQPKIAKFNWKSVCIFLQILLSLLLLAIAHFLPGYSLPSFLLILQEICYIFWDQFLISFFAYNCPCYFEHLISLCNCDHSSIPLYELIKYPFDITSWPNQALISEPGIFLSKWNEEVVSSESLVLRF